MKKNAGRIVESLIGRCKEQYWEFTPALQHLTPECLGETVFTCGEQGSSKKGWEYGLSSNGEKLYYSARAVCQKYRKWGYRELMQELLHILLHLLLGDPFYFRGTDARRL